jgi:3-oxoacyl-[acyl-carrier protein] reductase
MSEQNERRAGDLAGRVAVVTGASTGLGFGAAEALARRGARVSLSSRGGAKLEAARERLAATGAEVEAFAADVRRAEDLERLVAQTVERMGPVDVLVANGGGPPSKPALELTEADWEAAIPLNLLFVFRLCRLVLPGMRERKWGRIVAINSVSARQPIAGLALSNILRPAVLGYLKTLSQEVAADGVTVNAVLPGYTLTERQDELATDRAARSGMSREQVIATWSAQIPAGRMARASEIGAVVGFICSPEATYLTGQALTVDGGYVKGLL